MMRPSIKCTFIMSSVNAIDFASADVGRNVLIDSFFFLAKVLIPPLQQLVPMFVDQTLDFRQVSTTESIIRCQGNWVKPIFCFVFSRFYMDMRRLIAFVA